MKDIVILISDNLTDINVETIIDSFKTNVQEDLKKDEFKGISIHKDKLSNAQKHKNIDYCIVISSIKDTKKDLKKLENAGIKHVKMILFIDKINQKVLKRSKEYDIKSIHFVKNFKKEYEEKGNFEKSIKEAIREFLYYGETDEAIVKKKFTWKYESSKNEKDTEEKEATLYLDSSMRKLKSELSIIKRETKHWFEKIGKDMGKIREDLRKFDDIEKMWDISENKALKKLRYDGGEIAKKVIQEKKKIASIPSVLITGPTGSGKSFIAQIISKEIFGQAPEFIHLSLLAKDIISSELFGVKEGAYSDAANRYGAVLSNIGRALVLDEIAEVPPDIQSKLLVYMDSYRIRPEGCDEEFIAPVFIIATTNKNIKEEIERGSFREDLYYRFRWKIEIPPLSDRKSEMRFLISYLLVRKMEFMGMNPEEYYISYKAIEKLENRKYRGNFRELEAVISQSIDNMMLNHRNILITRDISD